MEINIKFILKLLRLFYKQSQKLEKEQKKQRLKDLKKEARRIKKELKRLEVIRDKYYKEKFKQDEALRNKFDRARVRPSHRSELMRKLTVISMTYRDDPVKAKELKKRAFKGLKDLSDDVLEHLLTTDATKVDIERRTFNMTAEKAAKFGKELGFGAKKYIEEYGPYWRNKYVRDIIREPQKYGYLKVKEAQEYVIWRDVYGAPKPDNFYYAIKYGNKNFTTGSRTLETLEEFRNALPEGSKAYADKLIAQYKKVNKVKMKDVMQLLESTRKANVLKGEKYLQSGGWDWVERQIMKDLPSKKSDKIKSHIKKLFASEDGVNLAYSIGKGRARGSYNELFKYIEANEEFIFHPNNRDALAESAAFKELAHKYFDPKMGANWTTELLNRIANDDDVTYKPVDTSRNIQHEAKLHQRKSYTQTGDINELVPLTEQQKAFVASIKQNIAKYEEGVERKHRRQAKKEAIAALKAQRKRIKREGRLYDRVKREDIAARKRARRAAKKAKKKK